jgi:membrane protein
MRSRLRLPASSSRRTTLAEGIVEFGKQVAGDFAEHRMPTYAAALAYRGLFGLFPFVLVVVVLIGLLGPPDYFDRLVDEVKARSSEQVPKQLEPVPEMPKPWSTV